MNSHSQQPKWAHGGCVTKTAKKKLQHQQLNDRKRDKHEPHKLRKLSQKTTKKGEKNVVAENLIRTFGNVSGEGKGHIGRVKGERRGAMMVPGRGMEVARWIGSWCGESCGIRSLGGRDTGPRGTECVGRGTLGGGGAAEIMMVGKFSVTEYIENRLMKDGMRIEEEWWWKQS